MEEKKGLKILTARNGVALVAVLAILLILTLLLPVMFSMSEMATEESVKGTDKQQASYLARTVTEVAVAAFDESYTFAMDSEKSDTTKSSYLKKKSDSTSIMRKSDVRAIMTRFVWDDRENPPANIISKITTSTLYMYQKLDASETEIKNNGNSDIFYYNTPQTESNFKYIGEGYCEITYDNSLEFYKINSTTGEFTVVTEAEYLSYKTQLENDLKSTTSAIDYGYQYSRIENRNVVFNSTAKVGNKIEHRKCIMVLPTKPSEQHWLVPATLGSNQIFPDTTKATGIVPIDYQVVNPQSIGDGEVGSVDTAVRQPLYTFSCLGNMVISFDNLMYKDSSGKYQYYNTYENAPNPSDLSFSLRPETATLPSNDATFSCFKANNMAGWYGDAQWGNFVAFTATNSLEVNCPIKLFVNPCRTDRLGDGVVIAGYGDKNKTLYKVMLCQAPTIVFKESVNTFVSFYTPPASKNANARRMTSIILAAPENTPYSYPNADRDNKVVKAGIVYFLEDSYVWLVPYTENGSPYSEHWYELSQTVYYRDSDIKLYKFANAGDVFYFNAEVQSEGKSLGFSISSYFVEIIYPDAKEDLSANTSWWRVWSNMKSDLFNKYMSDYASKNYVKDDFHYLGNIADDENLNVPVVEEPYVVWES